MQTNDVLYYYIRIDKTHTPIATVAVGKAADGKLCRGITILSQIEKSWSRKEGRLKATIRLHRAMAHRAQLDPIGQEIETRNKDGSVKKVHHVPAASLIFMETCRVQGLPEGFCNYKAAYDVQPTELEKSLLAKTEWHDPCTGCNHCGTEQEHAAEPTPVK